MKTVYLDGDEQLNINDSVTVQVITDDASCAVNVQADGDLNLSLTENAGATVNLIEDGEFGIITEVHTGDLPYYTGPTTITPGPTAQTLSTAERVVAENIIINPIPTNYGLIGWNGAYITVS